MYITVHIYTEREMGREREKYLYMYIYIYTRYMLICTYIYIQMYIAVSRLFSYQKTIIRHLSLGKGLGTGSACHGMPCYGMR